VDGYISAIDLASESLAKSKLWCRKPPGRVGSDRLARASHVLKAQILNGESEERGTVALLPLQSPFLSCVLVRSLVLCVSSCILAPIIDGHDCTNAGRHCEHTDEN
jgi:hypothetical protein